MGKVEAVIVCAVGFDRLFPRTFAQMLDGGLRAPPYEASQRPPVCVR